MGLSRSYRSSLITLKKCPISGEKENSKEMKQIENGS